MRTNWWNGYEVVTIQFSTPCIGYVRLPLNSAIDNRRAHAFAKPKILHFFYFNTIIFEYKTFLRTSFYLFQQKQSFNTYFKDYQHNLNWITK